VGQSKIPKEKISFRAAFGMMIIGVSDRSVELPTGGDLEQADSTSWMAMYSLDML